MDEGHEIPLISVVCWKCKHLDVTKERKGCPAFPNGIPLEIWMGDNPHTEPYPGDNGIRFEPLRRDT